MQPIFLLTRDKLLRANFKQQNEFFVCLLSHSWDMGQEVTSDFNWDFSTGLSACAYLTTSVNQDGAYGPCAGFLFESL